MNQQTMEKLKLMIGVPIEKVEEEGDTLILHIQKEKVAKAIGSKGSVVRAAEMVIGKKIIIKEVTK
ncbi:MAG: transcription elongation factor NusA [Candidatus Hadarchaeales archaeon]